MIAFVLFIASLNQEAAPAASPTPAPVEKPVCRRIDNTGSRLGGTRVCKTRAEWEAESRQTQNNLQHGKRP